MMIKRSILDKVKHYCNTFPVIAITGPRQSGKTTFVKDFAQIMTKPYVYLDLEKPSDYRKLENAQYYFAEHADECMIIDEIQNKPDLFPLIRSVVDVNKKKCNFLILGSASPKMLKQSSETLAGRIGYIELGPFSYSELKEQYNLKKHYFYGGFPLSYLSGDETTAGIWLDNFIKTYLERDLPLLGLKANPVQVRRLWEMLAWQTGNLLNYQTISRSLGVSNHTVTSYIDFLEGAFMVIRLQPYYYNVKKRLVKSSKIYIKDTGILHRLLRLNDYEQLLGNPLLGHSWETFVINQIMLEKSDDIDLFFYRTHAGAEADIVFTKGLKTIALAEIKFSSAPVKTKSFVNSINEFSVKKNFILISGDEDYKIADNIRVVGFKYFMDNVLPELS